jgi:hypothetical protein
MEKAEKTIKVRKSFYVVIENNIGEREKYPMKEWLRNHPQVIPMGYDAKTKTSHELRNALRFFYFLLTDMNI